MPLDCVIRIRCHGTPWSGVVPALLLQDLVPLLDTVAGSVARRSQHLQVLEGMRHLEAKGPTALQPSCPDAQQHIQQMTMQNIRFAHDKQAGAWCAFGCSLTGRSEQSRLEPRRLDRR